MTIPISGKDLYNYLCFLGKGQHFRSTQTIFDSREYVIQVEFLNKQVMSSLERAYALKLESNPFADLARNPGTESISGGECLIYSKGHEHLFLFHRYTTAIIRVPRRTRKSKMQAQRLRYALLRAFPSKPESSSEATTWTSPM